MLPVEIPEAVLGTTQLLTVFWFYDKTTRIVLEKMRNKGFRCFVKGFRIHHWFIGVVITLVGLLMLSFQNLMVLLYENGIMGLPVKLSSGAITMGFRIFIDDLKDLKKQLKSLFKKTDLKPAFRA
ncbi:MAG: hypothetical protein FGF52_04760 [Candidatus Brockarchaeota archaeon]|nr:hypothetical protein [Candidatus Brockarchaeota archaeon]